MLKYFITLITLLFCFGQYASAQYSICLGESVVLTGEAVYGYCSGSEPVYWSTNPIDSGTDLGNLDLVNFSCNPCETVIVSPTGPTTYYSYSPGTSCQGLPNDMCGVGQYTTGGYQGPQGNPPSPVYYDAIYGTHNVDVFGCEVGQTDANGCLLPFSGTIFLNNVMDFYSILLR